MFRRMLRLGVCAAFLLPVSSARADVVKAPNWIKLMGGATLTDGGEFSEEIDRANVTLAAYGLKLDPAEFDMSLALGWEHNTTRVVALGLELQYDRISSSDDIVSLGTEIGAHQTGTSWSLLANLSFTPAGTRGLYVGGGLGVAHGRLHQLFEIEEQALDFVMTRWAPAAHAYVGAMASVGTRGTVGIQLGYRYREFNFDEGIMRIAGENFHTLSYDLGLNLSGPTLGIVLGTRF